MYKRPNPNIYNPASRETGHKLNGRELEALNLLRIFEGADCKFKGETEEFIQRFYKTKCDDLLCEDEHKEIDTRGVTANELFWLRDIYYRRKKLFNAYNKGEQHAQDQSG
jgi:hypothetical protein